MSSTLMPQGRQRYYNNDGTLAAGCLLYTYAAGTLVPKQTTSDAAGLVPNTNPIVLDAKGEAVVFWDGVYKVDLKTAAGAQITGWPVDVMATPVTPANLAAASGAGLVGFVYGTAYAVGTIGRWLKDLALGTGGGFVGFIQAGANAVLRTLLAKARERVSVADYLTASAPTAAQAVVAIQAAIDSGAKRVFVTEDYPVDATINLAANQTIDWDGGSFILDAAAVLPNGVLYGLNKANIRLVDPVINGAAAVGGTGINLKDCPGGRVIDGTLTKVNLVLQATSNATRMGYKVSGTVVDMAGWANTGCYISATQGVNLSDLEIFNGKEGVGVYNDALGVKISGVESYGHTQDGFVAIAGQRISHVGCMSHDNGQSGFTTQRQTAAENTRRISYAGCHAYDNTFDGFDIRGGTAASFAVDMLITVSGCVSTGNAGTGFYIVYAEGTTLAGCTATANQAANFRVDQSNRAQLSVCRSVSGANGVASGAAKAGIDVYNSDGVTVAGCISSNEAGATQEYGVSFTGTSTKGQVVGGYYENNSVAPYYLPVGSGNRMTGAQADTLAGSSVFTKGINFLGTFDEEGFGVPSHNRPKGSTFVRTDGGGGEFYVSNGGGAWTAH